ncbi:MAG TPA: hypothetical protein VF862_03775 [Gemmatimonadales bacterium]
MSKRLAQVLVMAVATLGLTAPLAAQSRTAVSSAEIDAAVTRPAAGKGDVVRDLLKTDQARKIAGQMGVSEQELSARVNSLDQATLDRLAAQVQGQAGDEALAGGNTVTIGYAALAIILLVVIILLIA